MNFQKIFEECQKDILIDRREVKQHHKPKKCKMHIVNLTRAYRKLHHLDALCKTLLLWRCLMEFPLGSNKRVHKEVHRKILRSFFFLLKSTLPEDADFLESLLKEVNSNSIIHKMIELRILDLLIRKPAETLPRLKSTHYAAQSQDRLEGRWVECVEYINYYANGVCVRIPEEGLRHARPIWVT